MRPLSGDTAVVTGAARGIGRRTARTLAERGAHVVVVDIRDGSETVDLIESEGGDAEFREGDVTDPESLDRVFEGRSVDVLVNNAGYYLPLIDDRKRFDEIPLSEWNEVMEVNTTGVFLASKAALPALEPGGRIVNISSGVVIRGTPGMAHYVASKAAVVGLTRAMATELGDLDIRVNAVMPGPVATEPSLEKVDGPEERTLGGALAGPIEPDDVAGAVAFLCSPDSDMMTGQILNVDGGASFY